MKIAATGTSRRQRLAGGTTLIQNTWERPRARPPVSTEAIYPWYMLHQSLIIVLLFWLRPLQLGPWLEPALLLGGTVGGCLLIHELLIRRVRWLRPLFGLRAEPPAASKARTLAL
ncbi:hypothetical protein ACOZB2_20765 [Pantoea endophytica]